MPIKLFDRVKQKTTTSGSGTITLGDSVDSFVNFSSVFSDGDQTFYTIESPTIFEVGIGTYNAGTVSRDTVFKSSNNDQLVSLPGDLNTAIFVTYAASGAVHTTGDRIVTDVNGVDFNLTDSPVYKEGRIFYDNEAKALSVYNDEADITLQVGQEEYLRVRNNAGSTILNGQAVRILGSQGTHVTIEKAIATGSVTSQAVGIATHDIENNSFGYITTYGLVRGLDTSDFSDGDEIFLSQTVAGGLTGVAPIAPNFKVPLGHVVRSHPTVGTIVVQPLGSKLGGGDVKSLGNFQESGVAFIDITADTDAAIIATNAGLSYDSGNQILQVDAGGIRYPDGATQTVAFTGQETNVSGYVDTVSGNLQAQITANDNDISTLQTATGNLDTRVTQNTSDVTTVSGIAQGAVDDVATASGHLQGQITSNDNDITALQTATGNLDTRVTQNTSDITTVSGIAQGAADDVVIVSGIAQGAADDVATASGYLQSQITSNDNDITALQTATGNLNTRVTQNDADITTVSGIAQEAADDVVVVSGLLYNNWNLAVSGNSDSITSNETVTLTGLGFTSVTYDESTNTVYISGDGIEPTGFDWNVSVTGLSNTIASGDTVTFTGLGLTTVTYDPSTNVISISGTEATFDDDLTVSLSDGKTFGRYPDGATIPASGKTAREVIELSIAEPIAPTVSLTSPTTVAFNQTGISNTLNFSHTINSVGASVSSASLEFRRGGVGSWTTLSTSTTTPDSFVHSFTDTNFNTSGMNYRYIVTDSLGASNTGTKTITPASYSAPSISWNLVGNALSGIETNTKRERGNVDSQINGTVTRNSVNVDLISYKIQYRVNGGSWTDIGSASIGPGTSSIASTGHNPVANNTANQIQYRIRVVDEYQQYLSSQVTSSVKTINFLFLIFYGPLSSAPTTSAGVRAIANKIFTDGSNPFNLNTGSTLKDFTVAMPNTLSISQVLDLDALSANITASYVNNPFNVEDAGGTNVAYNVYTMSNSVPYASNHRHEVTRS